MPHPKPDFTAPQIIELLSKANVKTDYRCGGRLDKYHFHTFGATLEHEGVQYEVVATYPRNRFKHGWDMFWRPYFCFCQSLQTRRIVSFENQEAKLIFHALEKKFKKQIKR